MKSAGWYFMKGGQQIWAATVAEIRKLAQLAADEVGRPVTVRRASSSRTSRPAAMKRNPLNGVAETWRAAEADGRKAHRAGLAISDNPHAAPQLRKLWAKGFRAARDAAPAARKVTARRNPAGLGGFGAPASPQWAAEERARRARLDYLAATKARRLAMSLRTRAPAAAKEAGRAKSAKFKVVAINRKDRFTIFRASRSAANQVAREFEAAGYDVAVQEA